MKNFQILIKVNNKYFELENSVCCTAEITKGKIVIQGNDKVFFNYEYESIQKGVDNFFSCLQDLDSFFEANVEVDEEYPENESERKYLHIDLNKEKFVVLSYFDKMIEFERENFLTDFFNEIFSFYKCCDKKKQNNTNVINSNRILFYADNLISTKIIVKQNDKPIENVKDDELRFKNRPPGSTWSLLDLDDDD